MTVDDLRLNRPLLRTTGRIVGLSTDTKPTVDEDGSTLEVGTEFLADDTGIFYYWTGSDWALSDFNQKLYQLIELQIEIRDLLKEMAGKEE